MQGSLFELLTMSVTLFLEEADSATHFTLICDITRCERETAARMGLSGACVRAALRARSCFYHSTFSSYAHRRLNS